MKRICVFVLYDEAGVIDDYKLYLLDSLKTVISDLIIVVNGVIGEKYLSELYKFTDNIFIRENMGYDGGAYKDIFTGRFVHMQWELWDEIILMNDTFYGPLFPWESIFYEMENGKYDFWGLSRCLGLKLSDGTVVTEHIQGYFIAVRKKMFLSVHWKAFWEKLEYPLSYLDAVKKFEVFFTTYFVNKNFSFFTWLDQKNGSKYINKDENPYMKYSYDIIKYCNFPVIKYRVLSIVKYKNVKRILNYIEEETHYDKMLILKHMERLDKEGRMRPFGFSDLEKFVYTHKKIYIFGHGAYGKGLEQYFQTKGWDIEAFVVSEPQGKDEKKLEDFSLEENDGIIIALAKFSEIQSILESRFQKNQMLFAKM